MEAAEYAAAVANQITSRTTGRFWYGNNAENDRTSPTATAVPQYGMVSPTWPVYLGIILTKPRMLECHTDGIGCFEVRRSELHATTRTGVAHRLSGSVLNLTRGLSHRDARTVQFMLHFL